MPYKTLKQIREKLHISKAPTEIWQTNATAINEIIKYLERKEYDWE